MPLCFFRITYLSFGNKLAKHKRHQNREPRALARGERRSREKRRRSNLHNFNFSLASRGSEEQRTTPRGLKQLSLQPCTATRAGYYRSRTSKDKKVMMLIKITGESVKFIGSKVLKRALKIWAYNYVVVNFFISGDFYFSFVFGYGNVC